MKVDRFFTVFDEYKSRFEYGEGEMRQSDFETWWPAIKDVGCEKRVKIQGEVSLRGGCIIIIIAKRGNWIGVHHGKDRVDLAARRREKTSQWPCSIQMKWLWGPFTGRSVFVIKFLAEVTTERHLDIVPIRDNDRNIARQRVYDGDTERQGDGYRVID